MNQRPVLNLVHVHLERLPGIDTPFSVPARPGVNLISGPNESGKSSVARTIFQLLWPDTHADRPLAVHAEFADPGGKLQARRLDDEPVNWTRGGDPVPAPELPGGHVSRCYHLGLLDLNRPAGSDLDQELAREIRRQMAGGFDLGRLRELFPDRGTLVSRRRKAWSRADQELQKCRISHRRLADQERHLTDLAADLARAQLAEQRRDQLVAALEHRALADRCAELAERIAALPPHMAQVRPGDTETVSDLITRRQGGAERIRELRDNIAERAARLAELTLTDNLDELAQLVRQMDTQQTHATESARTAAAAAAVADSARQDLAPELLAAEIPAGSEHAFSRLVRIHRELVAGEVKLDFLDRLLEREILADPDTGTAELDTETLSILTSGTLQPLPRKLLFSAIGMLLAAAALWVVGIKQPTETTLTSGIFGGALVLVFWGTGNLGQWLRRRRARTRARRRLERLGQAAQRPLPAGWTVNDALTAYLDQARQIGAESAAYRTRTTVRAAIQELRDQAAAAMHEAETRHRGILRTLGRDDIPDTPALLHELDRVARCRTAEEQLISARTAHEHDETRLADLVAEGQRRLTEMGLETDATVMAVQAGLDRLHARRSEAKGTLAAQTADEKSLRQAEIELAGAEAGYTDLCRRLVLIPEDDDNPEQVAARVAALPEYEELAGELANARRDQEQLAARLAGGNGLPDRSDVLALPPAELDTRLARENELAARIPELTAEMVRIRERVAQARKRSELEHAGALTAECAVDLAEALAEQRDNLLGRLLVANISQRHEDDTRLPVLADMNEYLGHFTGGRYRLRVGGDNPDGFVAVDNTGQHLELATLSDGTRAQLLLAARLAFLNTAESGLQAPLFLDEALTASDPERFDTIAGAIGRMAADTGRQIFYLTSNPVDLAAWQRALRRQNLPAAHVIDLAAQRDLGAAAPATAFAPAAEVEIPAPGTRTAAEYGTQLKVPALRPWAHENNVHLFHLWSDDLDLLHRLLVGGLPTLGQWRRLGRDLVQSGVISTSEAARIDARGQVYGTFLNVWQYGRGRPVTRDDLVASKVLSPKMLAAAGELLARTGPDAAVFMTAVNAGRIKHLHQTKKEALQEYLERHGHLDQREIRSPDQIVAHVLGTVTGALKSSALSPAEVRRLVLNLYHIATGG